MRASDLFGVVTGYSRWVVAVLVALTVVVGAGAPMVEQSSSLEQFQSDSTAAQKLDYVETNFSSGRENTTTVQLIVRGEDVLSKDALIEALELQQALRDNRTVDRTLADGTPTSGVPNLIATVVIRREQAAELRARGARLQERRESLQADQRELQERNRALNRTAGGLSDALDRTRQIQRQYDRLNASYRAGEVNDSTYRERSTRIEGQLREVGREATANLTADQSETFTRSVRQVRDLQARLDALNASLASGEINRSTYSERATETRSGFEQAYRLGTEGVLAEEYRQLRENATELEERAERLGEDAEELEARRARLRNASQPTLQEQIDQLESMNVSAVEETVGTVLSDGEDGTSSQAFAFMPTSYEPGSTEANATMLVVFQTEGSRTVQGMASERLVDSQGAIQRIAREELDREVLVFGSGIISEETDRSMTDSLAIVAPLALLFVIVTLLVAYRDPLDILLGVFGIGVVLVWTFGFMGWTGITFNQIFIAVPVLLIGLSIDYAIHVFMRHREQRQGRGTAGDDVRESMGVALASVGVALVWVTATTVIGFLSNMVSPLPPIREFGVVSSAGILAALVVFGGLVPALKVEIDALLESWGFDRRKRAFGTGGGALGSVLSVGAVAARRAPAVVLVLTLVVSAAGAYGATQVDTSFQQEDFLAEDPPGWTEELPEPFRPGEYSAKANLEYVNQNFLRQDSQAQILVEGDVATPEALDRLRTATDAAAEKDVVIVLSNGEPRIRSPLSVMEQVAARNETFNETLAAADTDGDGVPDRNVEAVFDELFAAAPDEATGVIHHDDGEYRAVRMEVSVRGGASSAAVTEQMRAVADDVDGDGLVATATGQPIVFEIVQGQLLDTVIQSLIITLVAVFAFLAVAYRLAHGSATLGVITLLPVAFSVSWILGTMYLLGMPFNVLTGMITSLTVGLGVAYSIHLSERYNVELDRRESASAAMRTSVTGTGGALLGSAATTVGGFGVLSFAILPALQQFGIITALTIVYAFLASVLVLPSLLAVWTRYLGPDPAAATTPAAATANGGSDRLDADAESDWIFDGDVEDPAADRPDDERREED